MKREEIEKHLIELHKFYDEACVRQRFWLKVMEELSIELNSTKKHFEKAGYDYSNWKQDHKRKVLYYD